MSNFLNNQGYNDEDRYINKKETKRRKELEVKREEEAKKQKGNAHWMICPKCGGSMDETNIEGVLIDKCTSCQGIFFDKGEMELLADRKESHSFINGLKGFWSV